MLYDSVNYNITSEKRTFYEYMQDLIDKIYGVESEIVEKVNKRSMHAKTGPAAFDRQAVSEA